MQPYLMDNCKLDFISNLYSETLLPVLITDENLKVIWSNDNSLLQRFGNTDLSEIFVFDSQESSSLLSVKINEEIQNVSIFNVKENDKTEGYIIKFLSVYDSKRFFVNERYLNSLMLFFSMLRNNISGIVSISAMLQSSLEEKEMYDELGYLNIQMNYCYKILAETVNSSEMSRYFSNIFNIKKLDLGQYLTKITDYAVNIIRDPNLSITCKCEDDVFINIDSDRFLVAIMNIIINSIQYNISEHKEIKVTLKKSDAYASISISDNGIGISKDIIDELLEIIDENDIIVDQSIKTGKGYANGYDVISKFCKAFGCKILISSKEDEGTTVMLRIPLAINDSYPEHLQSETADYLINRFSNVYLLVSKACQIKYI